MINLRSYCLCYNISAARENFRISLRQSPFCRFHYRWSCPCLSISGPQKLTQITRVVTRRSTPKLGHILLLLVSTVARPSQPPGSAWLWCIGFHVELHVRAVVRAANKLFNVDGPSLCRQVYPRVIRANFTSHRAPPLWMIGRFSEHFCHRVYYTSIPVFRLLYFHDLTV